MFAYVYINYISFGWCNTIDQLQSSNVLSLFRTRYDTLYVLYLKKWLILSLCICCIIIASCLVALLSLAILLRCYR